MIIETIQDLLIKEAEAIGSRVSLTKNQHKDEVYKDEIEVEVLADNENPVLHPPSDTVYVIKTSGSTGQSSVLEFD